MNFTDTDIRKMRQLLRSVAEEGRREKPRRNRIINLSNRIELIINKTQRNNGTRKEKQNGSKES